MRWIIAMDAVTRTHSETSSRRRRRTPNRTHGRAQSRGGVLGTVRAADMSAVILRYFASIRMLVGMSCPGVWNFAPLPKVCTTLLANGTMSALAIRPDSAESQARHPASPWVAIADFTALSYAGSEIAAKLFPCGAAGPERKGSSWSGVLTLSETQEMSQFPALKIVLVRVVSFWLCAVASTPIAFHCFTASSAAASPPLPLLFWYRKVSWRGLPPLVRLPSPPLVQPAWSSRADAACGSAAGREWETESPRQATGSFVARVVAGAPRPKVSTFCSWPRSRTCVNTNHTKTTTENRPTHKLYHCSPTRTGVLAANRPALSSRTASGPTT